MSDRDHAGRFKEGNRLGVGNPFAAQVNRLRSALLKDVSEKNVQTIIKALVLKAEGGDLAAAKILLDRIFGPAVAADILERIAALEEKLEVEQ